MISTGSCSASAIASAVLPGAVGPISRIGGTFGAIFMVRLSCAGPIVSFRSQLRHCHPWRGLTTQLSPGPHLAELGVTFESRRSEEHTSELQSLMRISYAVFCLKK